MHNIMNMAGLTLYHDIDGVCNEHNQVGWTGGKGRMAYRYLPCPMMLACRLPLYDHHHTKNCGTDAFGALSSISPLTITVPAKHAPNSSNVFANLMCVRRLKCAELSVAFDLKEHFFSLCRKDLYDTRTTQTDIFQLKTVIIGE